MNTADYGASPARSSQFLLPAARQRSKYSPDSNSRRHCWDRGRGPARPRRWPAHAAFATHRPCPRPCEPRTRNHPERRPVAPAQTPAPAFVRGSDSIERTNRESRSTPALRTLRHILGPTQWLSPTAAAPAHSALASSRKIRAIEPPPHARRSHRPPDCQWGPAENVLVLPASTLPSVRSRSSAGSHLAGQRAQLAAGHSARSTDADLWWRRPTVPLCAPDLQLCGRCLPPHTALPAPGS